MSQINTTPELFEDNLSEPKLSKEELLMNENDILSGLIELGDTRNNPENYRRINIEGKDKKTVLSFRIRPISEQENQICWRQATKYSTKPGKPKTAIETDAAKFRSWLIYTATVDEDRKKIWDNKQALKHFNIFQGVDLIDKVLIAGQKAHVIDIIDEISGFNENSDADTDELAKN